MTAPCGADGLMTRPSPGLRPPSPGGRGISAEVSARCRLIEILLPPGEGARSADETTPAAALRRGRPPRTKIHPAPQVPRACEKRRVPPAPAVRSAQLEALRGLPRSAMLLGHVKIHVPGTPARSREDKPRFGGRLGSAEKTPRRVLCGLTTTLSRLNSSRVPRRAHRYMCLSVAILSPSSEQGLGVEDVLS